MSDPFDIPGLRRERSAGGLEHVIVETPAVSAALCLQGAQLTRWRPGGHRDVLWLSPRAHDAVGKAIRGGVPLCAPWFGPRDDDPDQPTHGWFRTSAWTLAEAANDDDTVQLVLTLDPRPDQADGDVAARLAVTLGAGLGLELTVTAGAAPVLLGEALHAYLAVSDVEAVRVEDLAGVAYVDKTAQGAEREQAGPLTFAGEVDRVFATTAGCTLVDPVLGRRIDVSKSGSGSTIVWNPGADVAAGYDDIADAWRGFACVEVGNALADRVRLAAGESHTMTARYDVAEL